MRSVDGLDADRQPDDVGAGARRRSARSSVSWRCVVDAGWRIRLRVSPTLARCDHSSTPSTSRTPGLEAAAHAEREHRAGAQRQVLRRERRSDGLDGRPAYDTQATAGWPSRNSATATRIRDVALHAQRQRLDARSGCGTRWSATGPDRGRAARRRAPSSRTRSRRRSRWKSSPWYAGSGPARNGNLPLRVPVEPAGLDDDAAHRRAVAGQELGQRVDDDVGAPLERPAQVRASRACCRRSAGSTRRVRDRRPAPRGRRRRRPGWRAISTKMALVRGVDRGAHGGRVRRVDEDRPSSRAAGTCG